MSLEKLYNEAATGTYVAKVKSTQASDVGAVAADSFFDGERKRTKTTANTDIFQKEFTRNNAGSYAIGGSQGTVPATNDKAYTYSRWTGEALKLPFDGKGPVSLEKGFYDTTRFRTATTPKGSTSVHNYTPTVGKGYVDKNTFAFARANAVPTSY